MRKLVVMGLLLLNVSKHNLCYGHDKTLLKNHLNMPVECHRYIFKIEEKVVMSRSVAASNIFKQGCGSASL
jgi:hypothetical protein